MPLETARRYSFGLGGILANAPRASGVYALFRGEELCHVDEADSIYTALLNHWDQKKSAGKAEVPTSFAFEKCTTREGRSVRVAQLVFQCRPAYIVRQELAARER